MMRKNLNSQDIILSKGEGIDLDDDAPAILRGYVSLLRLAGSIYSEGLINPITVISRGRNQYLIETGERRWLAHHLLKDISDEYGKIAAVQSDGQGYVWRQASENTARRELNAIGMARQLALLILDLRKEIEGHDYDSYETLVLPGGCDRRFYAQVANGRIHRIPKGMGERIQQAMGLSRSQLSHYRNLLQLTDDDDVNDAIWVKADIEDWPERAMREIGMFTMVNIRRVIFGSDEWSLDDFKENKTDSRDMLPVDNIEEPDAGDTLTGVKVKDDEPRYQPEPPYEALDNRDYVQRNRDSDSDNHGYESQSEDRQHNPYADRDTSRQWSYGGDAPARPEVEQAALRYRKNAFQTVYRLRDYAKQAGLTKQAEILNEFVQVRESQIFDDGKFLTYQRKAKEKYWPAVLHVLQHQYDAVTGAIEELFSFHPDEPQS
jgi:ParB-like chromosome segregation protein Spo0J